jgi:hypothetical protein
MPNSENMITWKAGDIAQIKIAYSNECPESYFNVYSGWLDEVKNINYQTTTLVNQMAGQFGSKQFFGWEINKKWCKGPPFTLWVPEIWLVKIVPKKIITGLCDDCGGINQHEGSCGK